MLTGRLLLMLVVMTATLAHGRPAAASTSRPVQAVGQALLGRGHRPAVLPAFARIALLQRVTLRQPDRRPTIVGQQSPGPLLAAAVPGPLLTRLPPPNG